jgi:hypothetical protein
MQILPQQKGSWDDALRGLGAGLGQGISSGLENLAQRKLKEVSNRSRSNNLRKAFPGISEDMANLIQDFEGHPETQRSLLQYAISGAQGGEPAEYQQEANRFATPNYLPEQHNIPEQHNQQEAQQQMPGNLEELLNSAFPSRQLIQQGQQGGIASLFGNQQQEPAIQKQQQLQNQLLQEAQTQSQPRPAAPANVEDNRRRVAEAFMTPAERAAAKKAETQERTERHKSAQKLNEETSEKAKVAKTRLRDLNRFEELEGSLNTPGYAEFLKRSGLDIPALMTPASEEFAKISANFLSGAKEAFGGRVSNYEVEQFLKTIPSLSQSPEGRKRVIANLKQLYRADVAYNDTRKEIIRENGGVPPFDIRDQIDDRIDAKMDKIAEQFKKDLAKPVPKGQNKYLTQLEAVGGSLVGAPGILLNAAGRFLGGGR